jgi:hypothetical protein
VQAAQGERGQREGHPAPAARSIIRELREPAQSALAAAQLLSQCVSVEADSEAAFLAQAIWASCGLLLGACCCVACGCTLNFNVFCHAAGMVSNALSMRDLESGTLAMRSAPFDPSAAVTALLLVCRLGQ